MRIDSPHREGAVLGKRLAGGRRGGVEEMRVLREIRELLPQLVEQLTHAGTVALQISGERHLRRGVSSAVDQVEGEKALHHCPSLAYGAAVETHEVGFLRTEG